MSTEIRDFSLESRIRELSLIIGDGIDGFMRDLSFTAQEVKDLITHLAREYKDSRLKTEAAYLHSEGKYREAAETYMKLFKREESPERQACYISHAVHVLVLGGEEELNHAAEAYKSGDKEAYETHMHEAWSYLDPAIYKAGLGLRMLEKENINNRALEIMFTERKAYAEALKRSNPAEYSTNQQTGEYNDSADFFISRYSGADEPEPPKKQEPPIMLNVVRLTMRKAKPETEHPEPKAPSGMRKCS